MTAMQEIDRLAQEYASTREAILGTKLSIEEEINAVKRKYLTLLRKLVESGRTQHALLTKTIEANPEMFERPRTVILHGIRLGFQKSRGEITWDNEERVIKRIRENLPHDQVELLIRVKESVAKAAVYDLAAADLKRLGIRIEGAGDVVMIKDAAGDLDKWIDALLAAETEDVSA